MAKKQNISKLFEIFVGEKVSVWVKKDMQQVVQDAKGNIKNITNPGVLGGYLIEEDGKYFYLGHTPDIIAFAVKEEDIIQIGILDEDSEFMDHLQEQAEALNDAVATPEDDTGVN